MEVWRSKCRLRICSKAAATGIFTQTGSIVCTPRKTHADTNNSHNDSLTCPFPFCTIAARWLLCVCECVLLQSFATNSESMRTLGKLCISKTVHQGSICSCSQPSSKGTSEDRTVSLRAETVSKTFLNQVKPCTINPCVITCLKSYSEKRYIS